MNTLGFPKPPPYQVLNGSFTNLSPGNNSEHERPKSSSSYGDSDADKPSNHLPAPVPKDPSKINEWPIDRWKRITREQIAFQLGRFNKNVSELLPAVKQMEPSFTQRMGSGNPLVSVIIPCYNSVEYTLNCIRSLLDHETRYTFEIIAVDDCSTDETPQILPQLASVRYVRNDENMGFIHTCNNGAAAARGEYVLFLNSDTLVLPGWLDELVDTFSNFFNVGLVGSKLLYPDGRLQEAGCIIWNDGSAWNYGRGDDPFKPEFNYARQADYCSGASIIVPRGLFNELGMFETLYTPAYCEDMDLALKVSTHGFKVMYQPLSTVIHFEGMSCGTDIQDGVKRYQVGNLEKCYQRWQDTLATHAIPCQMPSLEKDRCAREKVLIIDSEIPTPDRDAGSVIVINLLRILVEEGLKVSFIPANCLYYSNYTKALQRIGVECHYFPYEKNVTHHISRNPNLYDIVFIFRKDNAVDFVELIREYNPHAFVVFDTVDLHHLREAREALVTGSSEKQEGALKSKEMELEAIRKADVTLVKSLYEREYLAEQVPQARVEVFPLILETSEKSNGFSQRRDICFIGGFRHPPNKDAVMYFVRDIWPRVHSKCHDVNFFVIGSEPPPEIISLESSTVHVMGYLTDQELDDFLARVRLSVAPLRFGAGIKGKIGTSLAHGVPCVASSLAVEGMGLTGGQYIMTADDPAAFAKAVCRVYNDRSLWELMSLAGLEFVRREYSMSAARQRVRRILLLRDTQTEAGQ
jgi:GT2 family glycosyltransferase